VPDFKAEGVVLSITPYLKGETRSFNVKVDLPDNPREVLNPGMFARCSVRRYEKKSALTVPLEASAGLEEKAIRLFLVDDQNVAHAKELPVAFMDEGVVESTGLVVGQTVILHPGADLDDGARVKLTDVFDPDAAVPVPSTAPVTGR
jgi:multidrug efflux pump subunit AcrA (membrane-fusion protein)